MSRTGRILQLFYHAVLLSILSLDAIFSMPQNEAVDSAKSCEPQNCILGDWSLWSPCSHTCGDLGKRERTRRVLQAESCGGTCSGDTREVESCNVRCCPQNCAFSEWGDWERCWCSENECEQVGNRYVCFRHRSKVVQESCGGYCDGVVFEERCGNPCCYKDCVLGAWGEWSDCQARCEQPGVKFRNRTILQEADCGGKRCQQESEQRACNGVCCPVDCVVGAWSAWSLCPATTCGRATVKRARPVQKAMCGGVECEDSRSEETQECEQYSDVDCQVSAWSVWSNCTLLNRMCGEGRHTRTRQALVPQACRGKECPDLREEGTCYGACCRVNCQVSPWSEFGHCSTSCGEGKSNSTRKVTVEPTCGGDPCPSDLVRFQPCVVKGVTDCSFTPWAQWSACDNDCGVGQSVRTRTLLTPAYCGGHCPNMLMEERTNCESYRAKADCEVSPWGTWSACVRNCQGGVTTRRRNITKIEACGGVPCSSFNLTETTTCHAKCQQLCNQAVCSCSAGWVLQADKITCKRLSCGTPAKSRYCGPGTLWPESCLQVNFNCSNGTDFESKCEASCREYWVLKGTGKPYITCLDTGKWTEPTVFCGPPNKPPTDISVSKLEVSELLKAGQCFADLTTLTDKEPWDKHVYKVMKDESGNLAIDKDHLCVKKPYDFETGMTRWKATLRSTDLDGLFVDKEFTLTLLNDNDPPRAVTLSPDALKENSPKGTVVGCLTGHDDDPGQTLSMFIVKSIGKLFELFTDNSNQTCVRVAQESDPRCYTEGGSWCLINYEVDKLFYIALMVKDNGSPSLTSYFDVGIHVMDVNEHIQDVTLDPPAVPESVGAGLPLVRLVAKDEDKNQAHTFKILSDPSGLFAIDGDRLLASETFDYEQNPRRQFVLTVEVLDSGTPPMTTRKTLVFGVADKNESPNNLQVRSADSNDFGKLTLRENIPDTLIGTVSVLDPDRGDTISMNVSDSRFLLQNKRCSTLQEDVYNYCSAQLVSTAAVNFELTPTLTLTLTAQDANFHRIEQEFTVQVIDQNDPPTNILLDGRNTSSIEVPENQRAERLSTIQVQDEDGADTHAFYLSGPAASQFKVEDGALCTTSVTGLDYESSVPLTLVITAIDSGHPGLSVVKTFTVSVTDVNEPPTAISPSNMKVAENSPGGTVVGELSTVDPDNAVTERQTFTYTLLNDANGRFHVQGTRLLVTQAAGTCRSARCSLNHEILPDILIEVKSTDNGSPSLSVVSPIIVSITDVNDPPTNIRLSKNTVRENRPPGTVVGLVIADDEDENDALTFTLLNATDVFALDKLGQLTTRTQLDLVTRSSYVVAIRAVDSGQPPATMEGSVIVTVEDENEHPVWNVQGAMSVKENEEVGTKVGTLTVLDPDLHEELHIILDDPSQSFLLTEPQCIQDEHGVTCNVTVVTAVVLEFESRLSYDLKVTATDRTGLTEVKVFTVNVVDVNDPPTDILLNGLPIMEVKIKEGIKGQPLANLTAVDMDAGQQHSFSIFSQQVSHLEVAGNKLMVLSQFDFETEPEMRVTLLVTDTGSPPRSAKKEVKVVVEDVNEVPSGLTISNNKVAENSPGKTVVGRLVGKDPDRNQTLAYTLKDDAGQRFDIVQDSLVVRENGPCGREGGQQCRLNFETNALHKIKVTITDNGSPRLHATFDLDVQVTDANDPPRDILLSDSRVAEVTPAGTEIGKLTVTDEDVGQTHTFQLVDDVQGNFAIDERGTLIKAKADRLDVQKVYAVKVKATDNGSPAAEVEKTFFLSVSGVSEAPDVPALVAKDPAVLAEPTILQVPENLQAGNVLGLLTSVDNDQDSSMNFTLLKDGDGLFAVKGKADCSTKGGRTSCSAEMTLVSPLDYERGRSHELLVQVKDPDGMQATLTFSVHVKDVNEPPKEIVFLDGEIRAEENARGLRLGSFSAVDVDEGDSHSYTLLEDKGQKFTLSSDGLLATAEGGSGLDYETEHVHLITVCVTDSGGHTLERNFSVTVVDVNEPPLSLTLEPNAVREMSAAGTVIGRVTVMDPDSGGRDGNMQTFSLTLLTDHDGRFALKGDQLVVKGTGETCLVQHGTACLLDYETRSSYDLTIVVKDTGNPPITASFPVTVLIENTNDEPAPPVISTRFISEATEVGSSVATLTSTDQDQGQSLRYAVVGEGSRLFRVDGRSLVLTAKLDYEEQKEVPVTVRVTDDGTPPLSNEANLVLSVENVNEAPTEMTFAPKLGGAGVDFHANQPIIAEVTPKGSVVAQLTVLDPDPQEQITVVLSKNSVVRVETMSCLPLTKGCRCVGDVILERVLDYEEQVTWPVDVTAVDAGGLTLQKTFNITVGDTNDSPKELLINGEATTDISVPENSQDITLATLKAVDPDRNQAHSFSVQGTGVFYVAGDKLKVTSAASLDFETVGEYTLKIKVTDNGIPPLTLEKDVTIHVTDVNEPPTNVTLSKNRVSEDSEPGKVVGQLVTTDPDNARSVRQNFTYKLLEDAQGRFRLDGHSLLVKDATFDFEKQDRHVIRVDTTDNGTPPKSSAYSLTVMVEDANDPPTNLRCNATSIAEDARVGTVIGTLSADDVDKGQTLRYSLAQHNNFVVSGNQILVDGSLDFETSPQASLEVKVTDSGVPPRSITKTFNFTITDVNETPDTLGVVSSQPSGALEIPESTKVGDIVGLLRTTDPDKIDNVVMTVTQRSDPRLKIDTRGSTCTRNATGAPLKTSCTVNVLLAQPVNFEDSKDLALLEVKATDKGGLSVTAGWTFSIIDSNDSPTTITIEGSVTEIPENEESFVLGELHCTDPDPGDSHTFQLLTQWELFRVVPGNLLTVAVPLDAEKQSRYEVMVRCVDNGQPPLSATQVLVFTVKDVNERPDGISLSHSEVSMAAPADDIVGLLLVEDPDNRGLAKSAKKQTHACDLGDKQDVFYIDHDKNALKVKTSLPLDQRVISVDVTCVDSGSPPLTVAKQLQVFVVETADVPKEIRLQGQRPVPENKAGAVIGELVVFNLLLETPIVGDYIFANVTVEETNRTVVEVVGNSLVTREPLDFELLPHLTVHLACSGRDMKGILVRLNGTLSVDVTDVNEAPSGIGIYGGGLVTENSVPGTLVGDLNTLDPEPYQNYTYTIKSIARGLDPSRSDPELLKAFEVDRRTLKVGPRSDLLDFETAAIFSLTIQSRDSGDPPLSVEATVRVELSDANDPPTGVSLDNSQVSEGLPAGTVVGHVTVTDQDTSQTHRCSVTNLTDVPFVVQNGLQLVVARDDIDYETRRTYVVEISCQDEGMDGSHLRVTRSLTVNITDVNEAPYNVRLTSESVPENKPPGQVVGEIQATDPDSQKVFFSLDEGQDYFIVEGDNTLAARFTFNYEEVTSVNVVIRATDNQGLYTTKSIRIRIEDANDAPTNITISNDVVSESTPPGGEIGYFTTQDKDREQTFTYTLQASANVNGRFAINGSRLVVGSLGLDYETASWYRVNVTVTDSGSPPQSLTKEFDIRVTDANEPPTDIILGPLSPVREDVTVPIVLTSLTIVDQETNQQHSCRVLMSHGPLSVDEDEKGSMTLIVDQPLDFEKEKRHDVTISCSDGMYDVTKNVTLHVEDVNEPPTRITLSGPQVLPAAVNRDYVVGTLSVQDEDIGQDHTLQTKGPNSDLLTVKSGNQLVLTRSVPMDIQELLAAQVTVTIVAADSGQPSLTLTQTFTLPVTDIDLDSLRLPEIAINSTRVAEDARAGSEVGALYAANDTKSQTVVFSVVKDDQNLFQVKDNQMLILSRDMSTFTGRSAEVTLQARNMRTGETATRTVTVLVLRSDKCYMDGKTCDEDARCVALNESVSQCQCDEDFTGDGYSCTQIVHCVKPDGSAPCAHGVCIDDVDGFHCVCTDGYNGQLCEVEPHRVDPCTPNLCANGAVCMPEPPLANTTTFSCRCKPGWTSALCNVSVDDCVTGQCHGEGSVCVDDHLTYLCRCSANRMGPRCEYMKTACSTDACNADHNICVPSPDDETHTCVSSDVIVSFLLSCGGSGVSNLTVCAVRFLDFVRAKGRFPEHATSSSSPARPKRQVPSVSNGAGAPLSTTGVHVYRVSEVLQPGGKVNVTLAVLDGEEMTFGRQEVLEVLHSTCASIKQDDLKEEAFCPAIEASYTEQMSGREKKPGTDDNAEGAGPPIGIIAGAAGGAVALICVVVVIVVVRKRRAKPSAE